MGGFVDALAQQQLAVGGDFQQFDGRVRLQQGGELGVAGKQVVEHFGEDLLGAEGLYDLGRGDAGEVDGGEGHTMPPRASGMARLVGWLLSTTVPSRSSTTAPSMRASLSCTRVRRMRGSQRMRAMAVAA